MSIPLLLSLDDCFCFRVANWSWSRPYNSKVVLEKSCGFGGSEVVLEENFWRFQKLATDSSKWIKIAYNGLLIEITVQHNFYLITIVLDSFGKPRCHLWSSMYFANMYVLAVFLLPVSNAFVERVFSIVTFLKTKLHIQLSTSMLDSMLLLQCYMQAGFDFE